MSGFDGQIEAVREQLQRSIDALAEPLDEMALAALDHLTKANEELRAEVELAKQEGVTETLQQIDCLTGGDGEYRLSTEADRNCPDEDAMRAKIVARFDDLRATIDRLTKERDEARAEADPELLTIAWMDGSHRSAKAARDEIKHLRTCLSALQEAIDEAYKAAMGDNPCAVVQLLRPFATKPEQFDPVEHGTRSDGEACSSAWVKGAPCDCNLPKPKAHATKAERYRHAKRGSFYTVIGEAELQVANSRYTPGEGDTLVIYRAEDGKLWAREYDEFHDGRFQPEPEVDPLVVIAREMTLLDGVVRTNNQKDAIRAGRAGTTASEEFYDRLRTALSARGGRVVFDGRDG